MRYANVFAKTNKEAPHDADSANARLLVQGGFADQLMAGVYTFLPLGLRVLDRIKTIIREEMNALGAQEILMPALQPKEPWQVTGRWSDPGKEVMFQFEGRGEKEMGLGWTHEEIVTPLARKFIKSYRDLPFAVYQIQDKFRNEPRAKSGLLRGREFSMKDLYSFHRDEADLEVYYEKAKVAYLNVFKRCGLDALVVEASGGAFSKYSHEFQVLAEAGEDMIYYCTGCRWAQNEEIAQIKVGDVCSKCGGAITEGKAIEVGNIFQLKTRFTDAFSVTFADEDGSKKKVVMGCYGIGPSRVMGTIAEIHHDEHGLIWPEAVAPFLVHVIPVRADNEEQQQVALDVHDQLEAAGVPSLLDDRDRQAGEKFADADLIGAPYRVTVGRRASEGVVELRPRATGEIEELSVEALIERFTSRI